jgi:HK97 family phage prohead protease
VKTKTIDVIVKAVDDGAEGRFTAYASVFDNIDSYGDMVIAGAFADSLAEYAAAGAPIPLYWRHRMDDPFMNLGEATGVEDDHGLLVDCQLDLETAAGKQTHKLLKSKRVRQMSFAYDVLEGAWVDRKAEDGGSYYELRKLRLHEVSIVPVGANQETEILAVKAALDAVVAGVKAGRSMSPDERQEAGAAYAALGDLLKTDQGKAAEAPDAKPEEPSGAKGEEPTNVYAARALAEATIQGLL